MTKEFKRITTVIPLKDCKFTVQIIYVKDMDRWYWVADTDKKIGSETYIGRWAFCSHTVFTKAQCKKLWVNFALVNNIKRYKFGKIK